MNEVERIDYITHVMGDDPHALSWITQAGFRAFALFDENNYYYCGYVEVPISHFLYGTDYTEITLDYGVNFSGCDEDWLPDGSGWWFGFDCDHHGDMSRRHDGNFVRLGKVQSMCEYIAKLILEQENEYE